ncbi:MAG: glycosyltransferase, partial [Trichlorobacter sp.]|nr:glycosyltransferase [Trichlorobacter sp.]
MLFWLALLILLLGCGSAVTLMAGNRSIAALQNIPADANSHFPKLSIIVAARNEQHTLRAALQSLFELSYPDYE